MSAVPETTNADLEPATDKPVFASLTADERAELVWDDETNGLVTVGPAPAVTAGQWVLCTDGRAGRVVQTMPDPSGQLRQVIVRLGRFWGRQVIVPAGWIRDADQRGVCLAVDRRRLQDLPDYRSDAEIAVEGRDALQAAGLLRGTGYADVTVSVSDGVAALSGHVVGSRDKLNAEQVMHKVRGVRAVSNSLVTDDDLVNLVAQALARDERTRRETIFVAASHGIVILSGLRNSSVARTAAEECVAQVPGVRGVSNYIGAPGIPVDETEQHVVQPRVGQEVLASDMSLGRVERVIMDRHNRRVVAMVVHGRFPHRRRATPGMRTYEMPTENRRLVIPSGEISFLSPNVVQLNVPGITAAGHDDFAPEDFMQPDQAWCPPYPFAANECLWATP